MFPSALCSIECIYDSLRVDVKECVAPVLGSGPRLSLQGMKVAAAKISLWDIQSKKKKELSPNRPRNLQARL